jgi:hypothetical protein
VQTIRFSSDDNRAGLAAFDFNDHQVKVIGSLAVMRRKNVETSGIANVGNDNFHRDCQRTRASYFIRIANNVGNPGRSQTGQLIIYPEEIKIHETTGRLRCVIE